MRHDWLLYGAYGYTGRIIIKEALANGLRPILAGRDEGKLRELAKHYGLSYRSFSLECPRTIASQLTTTSIFFHAAGPFSETYKNALAACLATRTHYLDITGEIEVLEAIHQRDQEIKNAGIVAIPGVGFDIVPSDCLARMVKDQLPEATSLRLAFKMDGGSISPGTLTTMLQHLGKGNIIRENGKLKSEPHGKRTMSVPFNHRSYSAVAIPWGDVATAYYSTAIPNIEVYLCLPRIGMATLMLAPPLLQSQMIKQLATKGIRRLVRGADAATRNKSSILLWAEASCDDQTRHRLTLRTDDGYDVTARASVAIVQKLLNPTPLKGALTPSQAYPPEWWLEVIGARLLAKP